MKVTATAIKTLGLGCIAGDVKTSTAERVEDRGMYYEVTVHRNRKIRYAKDAWVLAITE